MAIGPGGKQVACHLRLWQRSLWFVGGQVSNNVPVVIRQVSRGRRIQAAAKLKSRLEAWGYRSVTIWRRKCPKKT
jgi:hypothetical protein